MKKTLFLLALTSAVWADRSWNLDVNGDGRHEVVQVQSTAPGRFQVIVVDYRLMNPDDPLWKSPELSDGGEGVVTVGDVDGDGKVDLVRGYSTRGGPPFNFIVCPWTGDGFAWDKPARRLVESSAGVFTWKKLDVTERTAPTGRFVEKFEVLSPGRILATVDGVRESLRVARGEAELRYARGAFRVVRWRTPMRAVKG